MINIEIRGLQTLDKKLARISDIGWIEQASDQAIQLVKDQLTQYPPAPLGSTYQRSGALGSSWQINSQTVTGLRSIRSLSNYQPYAPFVQSKRYQARIHRNRWKTDVDAVSQNLNQITDIFRNAIRKVSE